MLLHRRILSSPVLLVLAVVLGSAVAMPGSAPAAPGGTPSAAQAAAEPARWLPDTTVLARVGDRVTMVKDFTRAWFHAMPHDLPAADSAGRAQWLGSMVNRDLLALEAKRVQVPLNFEDRLTLRQYRQTMLSNVLYARSVADSVVVDSAEIERRMGHAAYDIHPRHILFFDDDLANHVRAELVAKKITWVEAVRRYSKDDSTRAVDGDLGWHRLISASPAVAMTLWPLEPGAISPVFIDDDGSHIGQVIERRKALNIDPKLVRSLLAQDLRQVGIAERVARTHRQLGDRIHLTFDEEALAWAARFFTNSIKNEPGPRGSQISFSDELPVISEADTGRVLARFDGGTMSVGTFVEMIEGVPPAARPQVDSPGSLRRSVTGYVLEPRVAEEAVARGLEQDPSMVWAMGRRTEELMVTHLFEDSVGAHSYPDPRQAREFYNRHLSAYFTYPKVRYAGFSFGQSAQADSFAARLRAGEDAETIVPESVAGCLAGSVQSRQQNESSTFQKILFEEMRPGQVRIEGPGKDGSYFVLKLLEYDSGRQLPYEEASSMVEEDLQKTLADDLLQAFVKRLEKRFSVMVRPDIVMRIHLYDL